MSIKTPFIFQCVVLYHFFTHYIDIWFSITSFTQISGDHKKCDTITSNIRILLYTRFVRRSELRGSTYTGSSIIQSIFPRLAQFTHYLARLFFAHFVTCPGMGYLGICKKINLGSNYGPNSGTFNSLTCFI